jgi:hypothetical protein
MFGIDLALIGFFVTLGGKGGIDTYDGAKALIKGAMASEKVHDIMDTVHKTVDNTLGRHKDEHKAN